MDSTYTAPAWTSIWHVHLKVANIQRALDFYCGVLWLELITTYGKDAAFVSAGGYHHHIGLNTWESKDGPQPPRNATWLYHVAILYPTRKDLAVVTKRVIDAWYPIWASDHGVSQAIYLNDPDGNGIELYRDRPREEWPKRADGWIDMFTDSLDVQALLREIDK
jgi:catechol 2,3-dioxygenase